MEREREWDTESKTVEGETRGEAERGVKSGAESTLLHAGPRRTHPVQDRSSPLHPDLHQGHTHSHLHTHSQTNTHTHIHLTHTHTLPHTQHACARTSTHCILS